MAEMTLTRATADALIAMEKHWADEETYRYPLPGGGISIPLIGTDEHEEFVLDMRRSRVDVRKVSYNNRVRVTIVLVRLCLGAGQCHTNPDGVVVLGAHLHRYREGYGDKWATPLCRMRSRTRRTCGWRYRTSSAIAISRGSQSFNRVCSDDERRQIIECCPNP